jgi:cytidylate kinase
VIVAIDGPVGSGKSTVGSRLADRLGLPFVDSGHFYRALAVLATDAGLNPGDDDELVNIAGSVRIDVADGRVRVDGRDLTAEIYKPELNRILSPLAQVAGVRQALVQQQRQLGSGGVVMAGRDIGTVVFPNAEHKFFLTASVEERVRRRALQYEKRGQNPDRDAMAREVAERDRLDSERAVAPLRAAADAVVVDTDGLTLEEVVETLWRHVHEDS